MARLEYVRQECRTLEANLQTAEAQLKEEIFHRDIPRQDVKKVLKESMKKSGRSWVRVIGISAAAAILVFLAVMRFLRVPSLLIRAGLAVSILVLLGLVVFELTRRKKTVLLEEPDEMSRTIQKLQWNVEYLQQEIQGKRTAAENLEQEYREYCLACAEKDPLETDLEGVRLALETIGKLSADMEKRVGAALKRRMSEILARITDGKYLSVSLDRGAEYGPAYEGLLCSAEPGQPGNHGAGLLCPADGSHGASVRGGTAAGAAGRGVCHVRRQAAGRQVLEMAGGR